MPSGRLRHPDKDLERVLRWMESRGWKVTNPKTGKGYFKAYCPCGQHLKWISLTPSGSRYAQNLRAEVLRECPTQQED